MTDIIDIARALEWKLLDGSHEFPGPDGGTCINEAAIVVAGFPYRKVGDVDDVPKCFSRPIARFAIWLNDVLNDEERQRLIPFVTRLAGTADTYKMERIREHFIIDRGNSLFGAADVTSIDEISDGEWRLHQDVGEPPRRFWEYWRSPKVSKEIRQNQINELIKIFDLVLALGKQADPIGLDLIEFRAKAAKRGEIKLLEEIDA